MSVTQDSKIRQITQETMVIGVDIASEKQYARAFDWRGLELGKVFSFPNDKEGFAEFGSKVTERCRKSGKTKVVVGIEPTGHYWFTFAGYLKSQGLQLVMVNPYHVKQAKELDDGHPSKTDRKDPKTIAKLVIDGRYIIPYIPEGPYADLRIVMNCRWQVQKELVSIKNKLKRWLKIYFPEFVKVFVNPVGVASLAILRAAPMPSDLAVLLPEGINGVWRGQKIRAVGMKRANELYAAAKNSVGSTNGTVGARLELRMLLDDFETKSQECARIMSLVEQICSALPEIATIQEIKGVGLVTAAGFVAEVGDIRRFDSPKQIQKLAGYAIKENSSGKHKGMTGISKRGRRRLRTILFRAAVVLVAQNKEFKELHRYFTKRTVNPLKNKQSIVAVSCKLIRVIFALVSKGRHYDPERMLADIHRNAPLKAA